MTKKIWAVLFAMMIILAGCGTADEKQDQTSRRKTQQMLDKRLRRISIILKRQRKYRKMKGLWKWSLPWEQLKSSFSLSRLQKR